MLANGSIQWFSSADNSGSAEPKGSTMVLPSTSIEHCEVEGRSCLRVKAGWAGECAAAVHVAVPAGMANALLPLLAAMTPLL